MVKSVKFIKIKGPRETSSLGFDKKICLGGADLADFGNLPKGGMVTLRIG